MNRLRVSALLPAFRPRRRTLLMAQFFGLVASDLLTLLVVFKLIVETAAPSGISLNASAYTLMGLLWIFWFSFVKHSYTRRHAYWAELQQLIAASLILSVCGCLVQFLIGKEQVFTSWMWVFVLLALFTPVARSASRTLLKGFNLWNKPTLIFGVGENAHQAHLALKSEPVMGYVVSGFAMPAYEAGPDKETLQSMGVALPCAVWRGDADDIRTLSHFHCVIALESEERELRDSLIRQLTQHQLNDVQVIPAMRGVPLYGLETSHFFSHEVLMIQVRNNLAYPLYRALKRAFDIVGALALLGILSPLFALLAYKVSRDGGAAFFGHVRVGQNGKPFKCYKFRSMVVNAQEALQQLLAADAQARAEWAQDFKLKNDPRVSKIGHVLRRTSLDELPQLWNVLKGEMSLVGPRPVVQAELERYGEDVDYYLLAKPGMTGLWQVSGRNDVDYATRVYLDSWYVKNWSLWTDIAILFKTISVVTERNGAY